MTCTELRIDCAIWKIDFVDHRYFGTLSMHMRKVSDREYSKSTTEMDI